MGSEALRDRKSLECIVRTSILLCCTLMPLTGAGPQLIPRRLRNVFGRTRARRGDPVQLRELHARFSGRGKVEGQRRESRIGEDPVDPAPPLSLLALAEAFSGRTPPPEVLIFGDSTSLLVSRFDVWRQPLLEILVKRLRPLRTCVVAHIGWHGAVQAALLRAVAALPCQPRVVVLPINLRQTSPQWAANPYFQFEDLIDAATAFALGPTRALPVLPPFPRGPVTEPGPDIDPLRWEQFRSMPVRITALDMASTGAETVGDLIDLIATAPETKAERRERMRAVFAYHWLPGEDLGRLAGLGEAVGIAERFGARIVGQLTPINYQAGRELLGPAFDRVVADFRSASIQACTDSIGNPENLLLEDLTHLLPSEDFFYRTDPTEHFGEIGRLAVARHMARVISRAATYDLSSRRIVTADGGIVAFDGES